MNSAVTASPLSQEIIRPPQFRKITKRSNGFESNVMIFLDYDDTLLASSFLAANKCLRLDVPVPAEIASTLQSLSRVVARLLTVALECGPVCIITNSEAGWVELSARKFMPEIVSLLDKVTVISARSTFEKQYPGAPPTWKKLAFKEAIVQTFCGDLNCEKNILSFGDSQTERDAILSCSKEMNNVLCKSIKLVEHPSVEQLRTQLELVIDCFRQLISYTTDLDLMLQLQIPAAAAAASSSPAAPPEQVAPAVQVPA